MEQVDNINKSIIDKNQVYMENNIYKCDLESLSPLINKNASLISEHNNNLSNTNSILLEINDTLSSIPNGSYPLTITSGILSAIVAAGVAFFLNYLFWRKIRTHNRISHFAQLSIELLDLFEMNSTNYWSINGNKKNQLRIKNLETQIKSNFTVLRVSLTEFEKRVPSKFRDDKDLVIQFINEIYDKATGDSFESANRKSEPRRSQNISSSCSKMKALLIRYSQVSNV